MSTETNTPHKKRKHSVAMFDLNKLYIPSQAKDFFELHASSFCGGVNFSIVGGQPEQPLEITIIPDRYGTPNGIPDEVVYTLFEVTVDCDFNIFMRGYDPWFMAGIKRDPAVVLTDSPDVLKLQLVLGDLWSQSISVGHTCLLEVARLRDEDEEIEVLPVYNAASYLSLSSNTACAQNQVVEWNGDGPLISASHFHLSDDYKQITILKEGVYQVNVRLADSNRSEEEPICLQLNGADRAVCFYRYRTGDKPPIAVHIHEVVQLSVGDVLQVRCDIVSNSPADQVMNRFSMLFLGN